MVFVPDDNSNTYVVTHWTNPGDYASTDGVPFATDLINSTQLLPAPSSQDSQAAYAASPSDIVQVNSQGEIYYLSGAINNYQVNSGATWTKMSYLLSGISGGSGNSSAAPSSSGSASATSGSSSSGSGASTSSASSGAASASSSPNAGAKAVSSSLRLDVAGLTLGAVALGMALLM